MLWPTQLQLGRHLVSGLIWFTMYFGGGAVGGSVHGDDIFIGGDQDDVGQRQRKFNGRGDVKYQERNNLSEMKVKVRNRRIWRKTKNDMFHWRCICLCLCWNSQCFRPVNSVSVSTNNCSTEQPKEQSFCRAYSGLSTLCLRVFLPWHLEFVSKPMMQLQYNNNVTQLCISTIDIHDIILHSDSQVPHECYIWRPESVVQWRRSSDVPQAGHHSSGQGQTVGQGTVFVSSPLL